VVEEVAWFSVIQEVAWFSVVAWFSLVEEVALRPSRDPDTDDRPQSSASRME
jgi:hypothetical protein